MSLSVTDLAGGLLGLTLTLSIFGFLIKDNTLFRIAVHLFIGVAAGFAVVVAWFYVIWPKLIQPVMNPPEDPVEILLLWIPLIMSGLLLAKLSRRYSGMGSLVMAFLIGAGIAAAIGGAILGTLYPQVLASINIGEPDYWSAPGNDSGLQLLKAGIILISTFTTLIYFQFKLPTPKVTHSGKPSLLEVASIIGKVCITVALGVIFAGVFISGLSALVDRVHVIILFAVSLANALFVP